MYAELVRKLRAQGKAKLCALQSIPSRAGLPGPYECAVWPKRGVPYDIVLEMDEINDDFPKHRCGHRDWVQRHSEPSSTGRPQQPDRRHARAGVLEGQTGISCPSAARAPAIQASKTHCFLKKTPACSMGMPRPHWTNSCQ